MSEIFESPIKHLPVDAKDHIANDMEDIAKLAMNVAAAIHGGNDREVDRAIEEFDYYVKRIRSQIRQ